MWSIHTNDDIEYSDYHASNEWNDQKGGQKFRNWRVTDDNGVDSGQQYNDSNEYPEGYLHPT